MGDLELFDRVKFTGRVADAELAAYYQAADVYVCASQHEGFCVPLVESMYYGVPIIARGAAAVPETLGTAGMLFSDLDYRPIAEMAHLLISDTDLQTRVIQHQKERLQELSLQTAEALLQASLVRLGLFHSGKLISDK